MAVNPAFAGANNIINTSLAYRQQFAGLDGAPETAKLTFSAPLQSYSMGLGLRAYNDRLGASSLTGANLIYSYHIGFGNGKLSFGLEGGFLNQSIDFNSLDRADAIDNALGDASQSITVPDASFGMFYHTEDWYVGASVFHLFGNRLDFTELNRADVARLSRHFFVLGGTYLEISKNLGLNLPFLLKTVEAAPTQLDLNLNAVYNDMLSIGGAYRTGAGFAFLARVKIDDRFVVGYSYDFIQGEIGTVSNGNHEVMVSYRINLLPPARTKIIHPRFYF